MSNSLILLDNSKFFQHLAKGEVDSRLVQLVLDHYCNCISTFSRMRRNANWSNYLDSWRNEYFLELSMDIGLGLPCVDDEGNVSNHQQRFLELFDVALNAYTLDLLSTINELRRLGKKIVTVVVVGYDKFTLKLMVQTK